MRSLTSQEISVLEKNACLAEDWSKVRVSEAFDPTYIYNVEFFGQISLGKFEGRVSVAEGLTKHSGIRNVTLKDVTIGDDCLIENVGLIHTTPNPEFGAGHVLSVLNEAGDGNVMLYAGLTSNVAALMIHNESNVAFREAMFEMIRNEVSKLQPITTIGNGVRISHVTEVANCHISDNSVIDGAACLCNCTLGDHPDYPVTIGKGVICRDSVVVSDSSILDNARIEGCFVGEKSVVTGGFSAEASLFFANTFMNNGESCAAFCGPFSQSHHKGSLLIGSELSFYNAGSSTNFSNHAYKMGPLHWGVLERGTKTASGSHTLLPAKFGSFSVVLGKVQTHPDTTDLPFSYVIGEGHDTYIVPGRNIATVGLYRDIRKWPTRDKRKEKRSLINFDWLSPFSIGEIIQGKSILENLQNQDGDVLSYKGCLIKRSSLVKGIAYYDLALSLYFGAKSNSNKANSQKVGESWSDLSGLMLPTSAEACIVDCIASKEIGSLEELSQLLIEEHSKYEEYVSECSDSKMISMYSGTYQKALTEWISSIRRDAEKEFQLGDVSRSELDGFVVKLQKELD